MKLHFVRLGAVAIVGIVAACAVSVDPGEILPPDKDGGTLPGNDSGNACKTMCGGTCTDLKTDSMNCGTCGKACAMGASCVQGTCQCMTGMTMCNGACVDTKTDLMNCGKCGTTCAASDAGALKGGGMWTCNNGTCDITCSPPKKACVPNGCFDLQADNTNCGSCGNDCGGNLCLQGTCCNQGEVACNMMCTNTQTDTNNCGMCGNKCNTGTCTAGKCCSKPPTGNCAHALCTSGTKLANNCDGTGCVQKVCASDSYCCNTSWDSLCVSEVDTYCGPAYNYKCSC